MEYLFVPFYPIFSRNFPNQAMIVGLYIEVLLQKLFTKIGAGAANIRLCLQSFSFAGVFCSVTALYRRAYLGSNNLFLLLSQSYSMILFKDVTVSGKTYMMILDNEKQHTEKGTSRRVHETRIGHFAND